MSGRQDSAPSGSGISGLLNQYSVVVACFLTVMAGALAFVSYGIFFTPISTQFGWTHTETSGAFSLMMTVGGVLGIFAGRLGDKFGQRLVIVVCGVFESASYLLLSQLTALWQLYVFYGILTGIGLASVAPLTTLLTRYYGGKRGLMTGIALAGAGVGGTTAPPVALFFISNYGWQAAFLVMGGIILFITIIIALLMYRTKKLIPMAAQKGNIPEIAVSPAAGMNIKKALRTGNFWIFGFIVFFSGMIQQSVSVHLVPAASDLGLTIAMATAVLSVVNLSNMCASLTMGIVMDRLGSLATLAISLACSAAGMFFLLGVHQTGSFYLFGALFGLGWGIVSLSRPIIVADLFGLRSHGEITGAIVLFYSIGGMLGPTLAGYIYDLNLNYQFAFILVGGISLLNLVLILPLRYLSRTNRFSSTSSRAQ